MRIRLPVGRTLFVAAAFLFALAASLPLRLALDWFGFGERGVAARAATGSVWVGALQEARLGPVALGDVGARLHLLPLFLGRARLGLEGSDGAAPLRGAVTIARRGFALDDVSGRFRLGPGSPLPFAAIDLDGFSAGFVDGRCTRAGGAVRVPLAGALAGLAAGLSGTARCDGGALLLALAGGGGTERLDLRLSGDGRYRADLAVRTNDSDVRARLQAAGFRPAGGMLVLRIDGGF